MTLTVSVSCTLCVLKNALVAKIWRETSSTISQAHRSTPVRTSQRDHPQSMLYFGGMSFMNSTFLIVSLLTS